jgi:hypothetical protein
LMCLYKAYSYLTDPSQQQSDIDATMLNTGWRNLAVSAAGAATYFG